MIRITEARCKSKEWDFTEGGEQRKSSQQATQFEGSCPTAKISLAEKTVLKSMQWLRNLYPVWISLQRFNHTFQIWMVSKLVLCFPHTGHRTILICVCSSSVAGWLRVCPKRSQQNVLLPEWDSWCFLKLGSQVKASPHSSHTCGLIPLWRSRCLSKMLIWLKVFPHCSHVYGLSPLWMTRCLFKLLLRQKEVPHSSQRYSFTSAWIRLCTVRRLLVAKVLSHWSQVWDSSPLVVGRASSASWEHSPPGSVCPYSDKDTAVMEQA